MKEFTEHKSRQTREEKELLNQRLVDQVNNYGKTAVGEKRNKPPENPKLEGDSLREKLAKLGEHIQNPGEAHRFKTYMEQFENRCAAVQLSSAERLETYKQVDRLMSSKEGKVRPFGRICLSSDILRFSANPHECDQGEHTTCQVTTIGERLLAKQPSKAAKIIADSALTGHFSIDGKTIKVDDKSLKPGEEERCRLPEEGYRSYGIQVLNLALANDILQRRWTPEFFGQYPVVKGYGGEHVIKNGQDEHKPPLLHPGDIAALNKRLFGDSHVVLVNPANEMPGDKVHPNRSDLANIGSPEGLRKVLEDAKVLQKFPLVLAVDGYDPLLYKAGANRPERGSIGHVILITDYKNGRAEINNPQTMPDTPKLQSVDLNALFETTIPKKSRRALVKYEQQLLKSTNEQ
jgi:hypothetical protein